MNFMASASSSSLPNVNPFEEVVPFSVSASAFSSAPPFDVFINHCGADVKFTLATTIHDKLTNLGLSVFLDVHSLQLGDVIPAQIEEAMRTARLHIAIFSLKYAHSPWCLAELAFMLKTGIRIIPVFYHVDPSDLRWVSQEKGVYAPAFSQYQQKGRYSEKKLDEWKMALETVSFRSGCVIKDNKDEAMQLKNIVTMVSKVLETVALVVAEKPVGLDDIVGDFERNTAESAEKEKEGSARIVGIVGMGGAGKTTLAKELYNRKSSSFQSSSIVLNVRDAASRNTLHEKQKRILGDLGVQGLSFDDIEEGKAILANRLRSVCALIILDDVDHRSQLDALLPPKDRLGSGSLVIVTTRELHLLAKWGTTIYRMKPLDPLHAKELFCSHAFLQSSPKEGFENIVEEFLEACHGLPLSLEVIGGLVFDRSKDFWKSQLDKISRMLPEDIKGRLKVSYDALDEEDKEMFMDVACFFIGEKISLAIEIWDGSRWSGLHGWETLVNKCLVNVDKSNCITMHDHLRDLGRDLAGKHIPCRVWLPEQIMNIQKQSREGLSIRGIDAGGFEYAGEPLGYWQRLKKLFELIIGISNRYFGRPPPPSLGLKLFAGKEEVFIKYFCTTSEEPVWLRFDRYNGRKLQAWSLRKLRILELRSAYWLRELWDNSDPPLQLRELIIDKASMLQRIPNSIGRLEELKMVALSGCAAMENLPEEFCDLRSLEWLELRSCSMMSSLPSHLGHLINLRHVDLSYCERLQVLPDSFNQLRHLQHLNLSYCTELIFTSDMLENISNLEYLNFEGCRKLEELPNQITHKVFLRELHVKHTGIRKVPNDIGELRKLEVLAIESPFLAILPSSLGNLSSLTQLTISSPLLTSLPSSFKDLSRLIQLHIMGCKMLNSLPDFVGSLTLLNSISITSTAVSKISISEDSCPSLETLSLRNNGQLVDIHCLPTSMRRLEVSDSQKLKKLMGLRGLANLQFLSIHRCPELNELASFADLQSLKEVSIEDCDEVVKIEGLQNLRSLETLEAVTRWKCQGMQSLEGTEKLKRLKMVVENMSAHQHCIQTMKKWPREMLICGRAASGAESVMDSLSFPTLKMVNRSLEKSPRGDAWEVECGKRHNSDAALVCLLVNSWADSTFRFFFSDGNASKRLREGKWVIVGVWTQNCSLTDKLTVTAQRWNGRGEVERAILLVGEEGRLLEAFAHFWAVFI